MILVQRQHSGEDGRRHQVVSYNREGNTLRFNKKNGEVLEYQDSSIEDNPNGFSFKWGNYEFNFLLNVGE